MSIDEKQLNAGTAPALNYVTFDGLRPPGRSYPTGAGSPRKWDEQGGYGFSGATLIYLGNGLSEFDVVVDLWDASHWSEWNTFARVLEKAPTGARPKAIAIVHPLLNRAPLRITQVVVVDVSQFEQVSAGLWSCRIRCKDFRVAKPALGRPDGTIPGASLEAAASSYDSLVARLTGRVDELNKELNESQKRGMGLP